MNNFNKKQKITLIMICIIIMIFGIYYIYGKDKDYEIFDNEQNIILPSDEENTDNESKYTDTKNIEENSEEKIVVHITGSVKNQGIVELKIPARIKDAVDAAGGLTDDANLLEVNLAYQLEDGMKIYIPSNNDNDIKDETEETLSKSVVTKEVSKKVVTSTEEKSTKLTSENTINIVNINTATQTELETLPGIGPSIALKIIKYREENGKFSNVEDIKNVSGIGDSKYEAINDYICVK